LRCSALATSSAHHNSKELSSDILHTPRAAHRPAIGLIRLGWAAVLFAAPAKLLDVLGCPTDHISVTVARVLGVRHALQGGVEVTTWPRWRRTGSFVDAAHSLTVAALALGAPRSRWALLAGAA
jgi:hypothetical protein